jgi:hypothetical protein
MLTDGLKAQEKEDTIKQLDIAEILAKSVGVGGTVTTEAAAAE